MRSLSLTARGCLPPLVTTIGGFAAQEAIIALTGKFSPLHQWVSEPVHELFKPAEYLAHLKMYFLSSQWTK